MKTYLNDAIIGNKEVKCGLTNKGEITRLRYPNIDYREFIEFFHMGVKINDSGLIYLHNDPNNIYMLDEISFETIPAYNTNKLFHPKKNGWVRLYY